MANTNHKINVEIGMSTTLDRQGINELQRELQNLKNLSGQDLINIGKAENLDQANLKLKAMRESVTQIQAALNKSYNFNLKTTDLTKLNTELKKLD